MERDKYKGIRRSKKTQKGFSNPLLRISISKIMWMNNIWLYFGSDLAAWPSGKAGTANPLSPVQIWVSPDQKNTLDFLLYGMREGLGQIGNIGKVSDR